VFWLLISLVYGRTCPLVVQTDSVTGNGRTLPLPDQLEHTKGVYTLTLPCTVTPYRDSVNGTRGHVTYQKLVTR
jgi:hypothetical protein